MSATLTDKLTNKKLLLKNISLNFILQIVTILVGIISVPLIIKGIGVQRFGILSIIWVLIGYSSMFDLGLGRALTQVVSTKLGLGKESEVPSLIWTSIMMIAVLGTIGGLLLALASPWILTQIKVEPKYYTEAHQSLKMLAFSLPFLIFVVGLKGVLEAYQKFDYTNWLRVPILISNYLIPMFSVRYSDSLSMLVLILVVGRIVTCGGYFLAVYKTVHNFLADMHFNRGHCKELFQYGGWLTVSNVISPLMSYMDRFVIASILSAQVVAYYSTPYDVISKMSIVTAAVMSVIFPALSTEFSRASGKARTLYQKSLNSLALILLVPTVIGIVFANPLIALWINPTFADHSALVAQLIFVSLYIQCLNTVPFSVIQAKGRSDLTAKIYLAEFPVYIGLMQVLIHQLGIIGAPVAAIIRIVLDSALMHFYAMKFIRQSETSVRVGESVQSGMIALIPEGVSG